MNFSISSTLRSWIYMSIYARANMLVIFVFTGAKDQVLKAVQMGEYFICYNQRQNWKECVHVYTSMLDTAGLGLKLSPQLCTGK